MRLCAWTRARYLGAGLLTLLLEESEQRGAGHLDDLETDTGNIADGMAGSTGTSNENLVVFLDEVEATIAGDEGRDLLAGFDELHTHALSRGGVGLLGFNADLLDDDALGVGRTLEGLILPLRPERNFLVALVGPSLLAPPLAQLAGAVHTASDACITKTLSIS